jgi:tetratricopeptide (TPR) repeat protein
MPGQMKQKTVVTQGKRRSGENQKSREQSVRASAPASAPALSETPSSNTSYVGLALAVLVGLVVLCYINSLWNGFVFDDHLHVLENSRLRSLINLPGLLRSYRPLRDISYAIDFALWGERAAGFHFTNLVIHAGNTVLVFFLVKRLIRQQAHSILVPVLAALIFALHPLQTDAVTYISGRRDVLFALFYLAAFRFYLSYRTGRAIKYLVLFLAAWVLSLLSKEMAASFPILIFTWSFCELWGESSGKWPRKFYASVKSAFKSDLWLYLALAAGGLVYTFYQTYTQGGSERAGYRGFRYWGGSVYHNVLTEIHVQAWYFKQLVLPTPITQYSGAFPVAGSIFDHMVIPSIIVVFAVFGLGLFLLDRAPLLAFAILSYFVMLLPVSQIIPHHELLADHYLYLPMMSFGLLVALVVERLAGASDPVRIAAWTTAGILVVVYGVLTVRQNFVWRDDYSLWQANYNAVPTSPRAAYSLGVEYISRNPRKAADMFRQCLAEDPAYQNAYMDLVVLSNSRDQARDVEALIRKGLATPDSKIYAEEGEFPGPFRARLTTALAVARNNQGDHAGAESLLWKAIAIDPGNPQPYGLLAGYYEKDQTKLQDLLQKEVKASPYSETALQDLTIMLLKQKKYDDAIPYVRRILSTNPNDVFANYQMSQIYRIQNDCARAWAYLKVAQSGAVRPEDIDDANKAVKQMETQCGKQ